MADQSSPLVTRALQIVDAAQRATEAFGRPDLTERLLRARERLGRPDLHALVVGEFKQGKSTLVNALLNVPLCPVSDEVATVVPTILRHGEQAGAEVVAEDPPRPEAAAERPVTSEAPARWPIGLDEIPAYASERGNADNTRSIRAVEIRVPRQLLRSGLALVDTPGVGGLRSVYGAATMAALGIAEVVVFVTDASQELSGPEIDVLRVASGRCPTVVCVLTKTDLYPAWRRIADLNRGHLAAAGLADVSVLPVSSVLRQQALANSSKELNEESGYPELLKFLNESVIGRAQQVAARTAVSDVVFVLEQLEATFAAEREVLIDPSRAQPVLDDLERAKGRAEQLRARSARWQQTLGDGSQDLATELDHDFRRRLRDVSTAAEDALDAHDPIDIWDDFSGWLRREIAATVAENAEVLRYSSDLLAAKVAEHFAIDEAALVHAVHAGEGPTVSAALEVELERGSAGNNALAAVRGSYGGILMFGMMGQLIGLSLMNPLTAVIGLGLGRKALRDERKRQHLQRRQQSKMAVRKYLDEVSFAVGKDSRDAIRRVQRDLRDEFTERAEQLQRSTREALSAAETAARQTVEQAATRRKEIDAELARLTKVRSAADELLAASAPVKAAQ
jgi:hypothetical protein